ncbi:MAG TPA: GDSL-type esterase/lipase family protein, partial [Clostridia bacterium]|nr:GDSL-type esterase/lipase family protein [Clostridia bacterium]
MRIFKLLTLLALVSAWSAPAQTAAPVAEARNNSAIIPVPRDQDGPRNRFEELNKRVRAARGEVDVMFLGDSITQGWEGSGKNVWQKFYGHRKALNIGIGGDRTQHVLYRLENGNIDGIKPKVTVLMIGTNNSNRDDNTEGEILEGVTAIVKKLRASLPETKIILVAIF